MSEPSVWRAGRQGERERGGDSGSRGVTQHLPRASDACVHPPSHSEYVSCIALCLLPGTRQVLRKLLWQGQSLCLSAPSTVSRECASHAFPAEFRRCSESQPAQWARPRAGGHSRASLGTSRKGGKNLPRVTQILVGKQTQAEKQSARA